MATCFIRDGQYFETVTDVAEWSDGRVEVPRRPGPSYTWDGSNWVDSGPDLDALRAIAVMSKEAFCTQLLELDILPPEEAAAAARGEWPATFANVTAGMPAKEAGKAQIKWAAAQDIHYSAPLLQGLALAYANGDPDGATAVLDLIFGIN